MRGRLVVASLPYCLFYPVYFPKKSNTFLHIVRVVFSQGLLCTAYLDKFEVLINAKKYRTIFTVIECLKVIDSIISFWMISLLGVGVFWGSYPRICRAKGTNQNFRKFRLSANWQPCSPSRPSLSRFVGTSRTGRTLGTRLLIW